MARHNMDNCQKWTEEELAERLVKREQMRQNKRATIPPVIRVLARDLSNAGLSYEWVSLEHRMGANSTSRPTEGELTVMKHRPKLIDSSRLILKGTEITCVCSTRKRQTETFSLSDPNVFYHVMKWVLTPTRPAVRQEPPKKKPPTAPRNWYFPSTGL